MAPGCSTVWASAKHAQNHYQGNHPMNFYPEPDPSDFDPLYEMDDEEREAYWAYQDRQDYERSIPTAAERNQGLR